MKTQLVTVGKDMWVRVFGRAYNYKDHKKRYMGLTDVYCKLDDKKSPAWYLDLIENKNWHYSEDVLDAVGFKIRYDEDLDNFDSAGIKVEYEAWLDHVYSHSKE